MPHLIWNPRARADTDRLYKFIAKKNRTAALRAILHIQTEVEILTSFPRLGKVSRDGSTRELVIPFGKGAYRVMYVEAPEQVEILAIRHSRELDYKQCE